MSLVVGDGLIRWSLVTRYVVQMACLSSSARHHTHGTDEEPQKRLAADTIIEDAGLLMVMAATVGWSSSRARCYMALNICHQTEAVSGLSVSECYENGEGGEVVNMRIVVCRGERYSFIDITR